MKSNSVFFHTLMLAAPVALCLQSSALAQTEGETKTTEKMTLPASLAGAIRQQMVEERRQAETNTATEKFQQNVDFFFPGGTPREFISAVEKQYKVDWATVAEIPDIMANGAIHIPALRMDRRSAEHIAASGRFGAGRRGGGGGGGFQNASEPDRNPLDALVALYNSVAMMKPELGELMVEGDLVKPSVVIFRARIQRNSSTDNSDFKLKAFELKGTPENEWEELEKVVEAELSKIAHLQLLQYRQTGESFTPREQELKFEESLLPQSRVALHKDTGLLIVRGPEPILEAAESLVTAWRSKQATNKF